MYKFDEKTKVLGSGSFGTVFVTNSLKDPNFKVAIKVIEKAKMGNDLDLVRWMVVAEVLLFDVVKGKGCSKLSSLRSIRTCSC